MNYDPEVACGGCGHRHTAGSGPCEVVFVRRHDGLESRVGPVVNKKAARGEVVDECGCRRWQAPLAPPTT